jgi:hypothetical protein
VRPCMQGQEQGKSSWSEAAGQKQGRGRAPHALQGAPKAAASVNAVLTRLQARRI